LFDIACMTDAMKPAPSTVPVEGRESFVLQDMENSINVLDPVKKK